MYIYMRIHLVKEKTIKGYMNKQARSRSSFDEWLSRIQRADWELPGDIKKTFGAADLLGKRSSRVVFDIGGNNYRMICKYSFGETNVRLYVCWIGTHAEYDALCDDGEQYVAWAY